MKRRNSRISNRDKNPSAQFQWVDSLAKERESDENSKDPLGKVFQIDK